MVGGLVQQEDLRVHQDEPGQVDAGLLPAGEIGEGLGPELLFDAQAGAHLFQSRLDLIAAAGLKGHLEAVIAVQQGPVRPGQLLGQGVELPLHGPQLVKGGPEHVLHGEPRRVDRDLGDEAHAPPGGDDDVAAVRPLLAGEDAEEGGLPRAVAAQDAHPLTGIHLKGEAVQHRLADLVLLDQVSDCDLDHVKLSFFKIL